MAKTKKAKPRTPTTRSSATGRPPSAASHEEFVEAWTKAGSVAAVAELVGLTYSGAQARARRLREAGVKLPQHARQTAAIDVAGLNALLQRLRK